MLLLASAALAYDWTVTVDPLTAALGFAHVQVEHSLGEHASIYVGPSLRLYDGILPDVNGPYIGLGGEIGVRGFFYGTAPEGGWVMVRGVLAWVSTDTPVPDARLGGYTSALVGWTGILGPGLVLSGGLGVSYFDYGAGSYGVFGFIPAAHTNIGWAF
jgi:hypothetical protein